MTPEQREKMKGAIQEYLDHPTFDTSYAAKILCGPSAILSLIAQVEALTVPQWISVETALPPIGQEVIVFVPGGRRLVTALMRLIRWDGATDFYWDNAYPGKGNMHLQTSITHWMPLPAAPTIPAIPGTKEAES
jgi:hypothetical protein